MLEGENLFQPRNWERIKSEAHERIGEGVRLDLGDLPIKYLASDLPDGIKKRLPCGKKIEVHFKGMTPEEKIFIL